MRQDPEQSQRQQQRSYPIPPSAHRSTGRLHSLRYLLTSPLSLSIDGLVTTGVAIVCLCVGPRTEARRQARKFWTRWWAFYRWHLGVLLGTTPLP